MSGDRFWECKSLEEMSAEEWDLLCDRCAKCCLHKIEDEDEGIVHHTNVACKLLNIETCVCSRYEERHKVVPDCAELTPKTVAELYWLPATCAYRLLLHGMALPDWHPLITGDVESTHSSGQSVRGKAVREVEGGVGNNKFRMLD